MKNFIFSIVLVLALSNLVNAQSKGVGVETINVGASAILDFPDSATKGILLPKVTNKTSAGTVSGTFVFDMATKKIAFYGDNEWVDMTEETSVSITAHDTANFQELSSNGVKIEDGTDTAPNGVLSLASTERALALPKVEGVSTIPSPQPGMICYDTVRKSMAVYNGEFWYFWD